MDESTTEFANKKEDRDYQCPVIFFDSAIAANRFDNTQAEPNEVSPNATMDAGIQRSGEYDSTFPFAKPITNRQSTTKRTWLRSTKTNEPTI